MPTAAPLAALATTPLPDEPVCFARAAPAAASRSASVPTRLAPFLKPSDWTAWPTFDSLSRSPAVGRFAGACPGVTPCGAPDCFAPWFAAIFAATAPPATPPSGAAARNSTSTRSAFTAYSMPTRCPARSRSSNVPRCPVARAIDSTSVDEYGEVVRGTRPPLGAASCVTARWGFVCVRPCRSR